MCNVGGSSDATGEEDYSRLLSRHIQATGSSLVSCQVAFPEGAEATDITEWKVKRLVSLQ